MRDDLLRLYQALPPSLRTVAATLRGYRLRWWRYGPESERLVAETLERDTCPPEKLRAWQEERLAFLLNRAATQVPYYRNMWTERRRHGDKRSFEYLEHWPLLHKEPVRANPRLFVADGRSVRGMFEVNTSGTTGKPMRLWRSRAASCAYYALLEARYRRWHGVSWRENWAILGGQAVVSPSAKRPPYWVWNGAMHQLYLSANHVGPQNAAAYASAMTQYQVSHLSAYPSSATELARQFLATGATYRGLKVVVANAEPLGPSQRELLSQAFGAPARETYGMVEIVAGASECPAGTLHLWPEMGMVEVLDDEGDTPVLPGTTGRLVCTGLINEDMPLVRYVVGDRGSLPTPSEPCPCGRKLPPMGPVEGRSNDMLIAPDGRRVYWLNPVFYGLPIHEAQIVQEVPDLVTIKCVPAGGFGDESRRTIVHRVRARMGEVRVNVDVVAQIPRGPNGKFQAIICRIPSQPGRGAGAAAR